MRYGSLTLDVPVSKQPAPNPDGLGCNIRRGGRDDLDRSCGYNLRFTVRLADHHPQHLVLADGSGPGHPVYLHLLPRATLLGPDPAGDLCRHAALRLALLAARRPGP